MQKMARSDGTPALAAATAAGAPFWSRPQEDLLAALHSSGRFGLPSEEANRRLAGLGPNRVDDGRDTGRLALLLHQFHVKRFRQRTLGRELCEALS
jgi:hypothetical protein